MPSRTRHASVAANVAFAVLAAHVAAQGTAPVRPRVAGALATTVRVDATAARRVLPPTLLGSNLQYVNYGDGVLDPTTLTLRAPLVAKIRELGPRTIRFPGGGHADTYHWRDGVGPQSARRIGEGYFNSGPQTNEYGTDEHLALCRAVGAEATMTLNFGTGTPQEAANWVEYLNGPVPARGTEGWTVTSWDGGDKAPQGYFAWLRSQFGHPEPYGVKYVEVGNEIYNDWSARTGAAAYARRFLEYVAAVKAVDPTVRVAAVGYDRADEPWNGESEAWNRVVARIAGHAMDALHVHTYTPLADGHSLVLASPQTVTKHVELPVTDTWEVRVQAVGRGGFGPYPPTDGVPAILEVAVDGMTVGTFPLTAPLLGTVRASRHLAAGVHTVSVRATNAYLDPLTGVGRFALLDGTVLLRTRDAEVRAAFTDPTFLHAATMAGPVQVGRHLQRIGEILREETGRRDIELWVTEANSWFGLHSVRLDLSNQLRAGIALADLAMRAVDAGVTLFQQWSLVDDWVFGMIADSRALGERASAHTFALLRRGLLPLLLPATVEGPTFDLPVQFGAVAPEPGVPVLDALATRDEDTVAVLLLNRHPDRTVRADVVVGDWPVGSAEAETVLSAAPDTEDVNPDDAAFEFVPGRVGQGVRLHASQPLRHPTVGRLHAAEGTIEMWVRPDWNGEDMRWHTLGSLGLLAHLVTTGTGWLAAWVISEDLDSGNVVASPITRWRAGDWHHVAMTWQEGGDLALYVDGVLAIRTVLAARWTAVAHEIGLVLGASSLEQFRHAGFDGAFDEVRVSRRVRSAEEIRASFQAGAAGVPLAADDATTTLLRFDGHIGDVVRDERTHTLWRRLPCRPDGTVLDLPPTSLTLLRLRRTGSPAPS